MPARVQSRAAVRPSVRVRADGELKIDPEFADRLRHVMYDRAAGCPNCKYNLSGIVGERCPECGIRLGEYLRLADTTPWRLSARMRELKFRRFCSWFVAPLCGAAVMLLAVWAFLTLV